MTTTSDQLPSAFLHRVRAMDPRWLQIGVLGSLVVYGLAVLRFDLTVAQAAVTLAAAIAAQVVFTRVVRLPRIELKSALISGLSLCLLLRSSSLAITATGSLLAIGSKFLIRASDKHVFNPTNLALAILLASGGHAWVSPAQWGNLAIFASTLALAGLVVVQRAARSDVTVAFGIAYLALVFGRSLWLGEPMAIPLHRIENGGLVLFAFFMISDPRTTPDSRLGRVLFGALVALGGWYIQFRLFRTNGLIWSLVACSTLTPILDRLVRGSRFEWPSGVARAPREALAAA